MEGYPSGRWRLRMASRRSAFAGRTVPGDVDDIANFASMRAGDLQLVNAVLQRRRTARHPFRRQGVRRLPALFRAGISAD